MANPPDGERALRCAADCQITLLSVAMAGRFEPQIRALVNVRHATQQVAKPLCWSVQLRTRSLGGAICVLIRWMVQFSCFFERF